MKKLLAVLFAFVMLGTVAFASCKNGSDNGDDGGDTPPVVEPTGPVDWFKEHPDDCKALLSADGYVKGKIGDFSQYAGTSAYRTVATADELITALKDAKYSYTSVWDEEKSEVKQTLTSEGTVHVIEITADINLGYNKLSAEAKESGIVDNFGKNYSSLEQYLYWSDMFLENGISQVKIENTSNLLVYSKNGAKITHGGFKLNSDTNVVFRNLQFDEMWQWEDAPTSISDKIGDYDWFGWAYFKIGFCGYIWIDHCSFGKSYDGQIDYANPVYNSKDTAFRAPYGADGGNGLHISWCNFNSGSDDKDGYIYKMMDAIEKDYAAYKANPVGAAPNLYYKALRDGGVSFEEILYGLAIPQKKGFLCGDTGNGTTDYDNNLKLNVSFANCKFTNMEDRLPKVRGGNAYIYNCIFDSSQYFEYRTKLKATYPDSKKTPESMIKDINKGWKIALVSQGMLCGNGASIKAENCLFKGMNEFLKNNDSGGNSGRTRDGGYQLVNCSYQKKATDTPIVGSTTDSTANFPVASGSGKLTTENFKWNTADGKAPFEVKRIDLESVEGLLANAKYGSGVRAQMADELLKN